MNVILIISDTIRHDYLGCYGNDWVQTPHIDGLAEQAAVMENFFCASFPTGMARKDFHSGRFTFAYTNWGGERPDGEMVLAEMLQDAGVKTAMIGDTNNSQQYAQGFDHLEVVPSAASNLGRVPETVELPAAPEKLRFPMEYAQRIARNALGYDGETDRRVARTMLAAHRWLESQSYDSKPFFLWVDTFDPHEPWDPPQYYIDLYDPGYEG
ncbi:MAG: sulfatase-like hydrolase/transferase, partial [Planctomycetota bacterium]|nr:sulfatase-like hydrolase/transferase [Planctomycetota bacterium]